MNEPSLLLTDELELVAADGQTTLRRRLSPAEGLDLAEDLIRRSTRRMMLEESEQFTHEANPGGA